jgi:hypothetical protein
MSGPSAAYLIAGDWQLLLEEPPCRPQRLEEWRGHPWAVTDPGLPFYQDCARCGLRRLLVPRALVAAANDEPHRDRRGVENVGGLGALGPSRHVDHEGG